MSSEDRAQRQWAEGEDNTFGKGELIDGYDIFLEQAAKLLREAEGAGVIILVNRPDAVTIFSNSHEVAFHMGVLRAATLTVEDKFRECSQVELKIGSMKSLLVETDPLKVC